MCPRKLNILHVVPSYYPAIRYGGPIRSVHSLCAALVRRGHVVHVYTTNVDGPGDSDVAIERPVDMDGVKVTYFSVPALRRLYWSPVMAKWLKTAVRGFDMVHLHSVFLWPTWAAARAAHASHVPYIVTPRGQLVAELIRRKSRWLKLAWIALIERRTLAEAAALHVTTDLEAKDISALNLRLPKIVCIPNGVSWPRICERFKPEEYPTLTRPYALFLSRINWKKGLDRLIRAWVWVPNLNLVIAGNDEEGYQKQLEELAHTVGVSDRVCFIGSVTDEKKWAFYEGAELFVLPSYSENFGNAVAEAMAMSCPVVVTPEVGLARFVSDVRAGIITSGDPETLGRAIHDLHGNPGLRKLMGMAGRIAVEKALSWDGIAAQFEIVYDEIVAASANIDCTPLRLAGSR
jgi:glycosyltransferase involved in cell wall biosynthesis